MKKLLFVINHMNVGGIQTSLIELLKQISQNYQIDLLCIRSEGALESQLPHEVRVIHSDMLLSVSEMSVKEAQSQGITAFVWKLIGSTWSKLFGKRIPAYIVTKYLQQNLGEYDVAISYTHPVSSRLFFNLSNEVVLNACRAKKKVTFVHCDFRKYGGNDAYNRTLYANFDIICAVSQSVGNAFLQELPHLKERVRTVYNICDTNKIRRLAEIEPIEYGEGIPIVTVARLGSEKGLVRCVSIVSDLKEEGYDVKWHIIGNGAERKRLEEEIATLGAEHIVILHGEQLNPYRYMKNAKLFLLPSFHEAAPMVFLEAATLGLPIVTTETLSAVELVQNHGLGWVCGMENEDIKQVIKTSILELRRKEWGFKKESELMTIGKEQFQTMIKERE